MSTDKQTIFFSRKTIITIVKIFIGIACVWLIASRLYGSYSQENIASVKNIFSLHNVPLLVSAFLLLFLNWGIEAFKWNVITNPIEKISFAKAWQSVWMGVCIGNLTPGRLGEFAGRILFFKPENRAKITTTHFVCGLTQLAVSILMGCIGLLLFSSLIDQHTFIGIISSELVLLTLMIILLARINKVVIYIEKISFLKKFDFKNLSYHKGIILKLLGLSVIRYFVFFTQFYLMLLACGIQGAFLNIAGSIAIMYLLLSSIPMISFIEIAVRAFIAILLFNSFHVSDWQLSAAATLLWLINIAIPSLIGYVFILNNKFSIGKKSSGKNVLV